VLALVWHAHVEMEQELDDEFARCLERPATSRTSAQINGSK
jgi:hypothetical protein